MDRLDSAIKVTALNACGKDKDFRSLGGLGIACEISEQTFRNKVNEDDQDSLLNIKEFIRFVNITGDVNSLAVLADECGCEISPKKSVTYRSLLDAVLATDCEHNDINQTLRDALADGRISQRELAQIGAKVENTIKALRGFKETANKVAADSNTVRPIA